MSIVLRSLFCLVFSRFLIVAIISLPYIMDNARKGL